MALTAIMTKNNGEVSVDEIDVVNREAARHSVGRGWSYRIRSGERWLLIPLDEAAAFVFDEKPEGTR